MSLQAIYTRNWQQTNQLFTRFNPLKCKTLTARLIWPLAIVAWSGLAWVAGVISKARKMKDLWLESFLVPFLLSPKYLLLSRFDWEAQPKYVARYDSPYTNLRDVSTPQYRILVIACFAVRILNYFEWSTRVASSQFYPCAPLCVPISSSNPRLIIVLLRFS